MNLRHGANMIASKSVSIIDLNESRVDQVKLRPLEPGCTWRICSRSCRCLSLTARLESAWTAEQSYSTKQHQYIVTRTHTCLLSLKNVHAPWAGLVAAMYAQKPTSIGCIRTWDTPGVVLSAAGAVLWWFFQNPWSTNQIKSELDLHFCSNLIKWNWI